MEDLIDLAILFYIEESEIYADYTIHDALYDASEKLNIELPDDDDYEELVFNVRRELGIDCW